jgi:hypothetical protein
MDWITQNWAVITTVVLVAVRVIESIVQATPGTADDNIWAIVKKVIAVFFKLS